MHVLLVEELIRDHVVDRAAGQYQTPDERSARDVSATRMQTLLADPDDVAELEHESDEELLERARRAAMAEMQTFLAEPDDDS